MDRAKVALWIVLTYHLMFGAINRNENVITRIIGARIVRWCRSILRSSCSTTSGDWGPTATRSGASRQGREY